MVLKERARQRAQEEARQQLLKETIQSRKYQLVSLAHVNISFLCEYASLQELKERQRQQTLRDEAEQAKLFEMKKAIGDAEDMVRLHHGTHREGCSSIMASLL